MKKLFLTLCVALFAMGAQAQEKGDFAVGVKAFLLADYKFQPGILGDCHVVNVGVGFRF